MQDMFSVLGPPWGLTGPARELCAPGSQWKTLESQPSFLTMQVSGPITQHLPIQLQTPKNACTTGLRQKLATFVRPKPITSLS